MWVCGYPISSSSISPVLLTKKLQLVHKKRTVNSDFPVVLYERSPTNGTSTSFQRPEASTTVD